MAEERKIALTVEVDASGVKPGLDDIKGQFEDFERQAKKSGREASKPFDDLPNRTKPASDAVDSASRSIVNSIQRATAVMQAGEKGGVK